MIRITLAALAIGLLASCSSTSSVRLGPNEYPAAHRRAPVKIYEVESDIDAHVEKVGIVYVEGGMGSSWKGMIEDLQCEARRLGANAIVLAHVDEQEGTQTKSFFDVRSGRRETFSVQRMSALAVRTYELRSDLVANSTLPEE